MTTQERTSGSLLRPGRNCWVLERATRFHAIQDGEYYRLFRDAVLRARHTVFILGWDINAGTELVPNEPAGDVPSRLDAFLTYAARRRPELKILILTWDYGLLFTMERDPFTRWRLGWRTPSNVTLCFDDRHPIAACHHQKIVVIDDTLAFSGGMDLTGHRWDTCAHRVDEPARLNPLGKPYGPYHEVMAMLEGPAAARLGELARERWRAVGAKQLPPLTSRGPGLWPEEITPDFTDVDVGIARTMPGTATRLPVHECEQLYLDAIASARRTIYIENQYFTHPGLSDALAARLRERDGPEVVLVLPEGGDGWLEDSTIRAIRDSLFQRLAAADVHDRLRAVYPVASRRRDVTTFVHAKVLIVDDALLVVGSANTNRRSMGMDTECDVAVAATGGPAADAIAGTRHRLAAEHLGLDAEQVADAVGRAGSLRQLIDARQGCDRTLALFDVTRPAEPPDDTVQLVVDPPAPLSFGEDIDRLVPAPDGTSARAPLRVWVIQAVAVLSAAVVAWRLLPSLDRSGLATVQGAVEAARTASLPDALMMTGVLVAGLALIPVELVLIATGLVFGAGRGGLIAVAGSLAFAIVGYLAGRLLGPVAITRLVSRRSIRAIGQVGASSIRSVAMLRLAAVASAGAVHLLCGAGRVPFGAYLAGTALGLAPAVVALSALGALLGNLLLAPTIQNAVTTVVAALVVLGCALAVRAVLEIRQFAPTMSRRRARAELG
jgi:phosphatidylserine/phosphatidylglycerophosphate/cardiolipin synthase-like enzyme/uncharacterized membrane protein YdjX (TVP38/TMEM64 family)